MVDRPRARARCGSPSRTSRARRFRQQPDWRRWRMQSAARNATAPVEHQQSRPHRTPTRSSSTGFTTAAFVFVEIRILIFPAARRWSETRRRAWPRRHAIFSAGRSRATCADRAGRASARPCANRDPTSSPPARIFEAARRRADDPGRTRPLISNVRPKCAPHRRRNAAATIRSSRKNHRIASRLHLVFGEHAAQGRVSLPASRRI